MSEITVNIKSALLSKEEAATFTLKPENFYSIGPTSLLWPSFSLCLCGSVVNSH